jgi:hypothetical protein
MRFTASRSSESTAAATARNVLPVPAGPRQNVMSVARICCRYCAWRGVRAVSSARRGIMSAGASFSVPRRTCWISTSPSWMSSTERSRPRLVVEAAQRARGLRRPLLRAGDAEALAAARDRHVERGLDLAQVRVERPAQRREPRVVHGLERDFFGWVPCV